jgi:cell division septation protein DedD
LRGYRRKSRNFVISFGDIMLPLIGVVAVGLLLLAGRFFFTSNFDPERASLPVIARPQREKPAQAKEREERAAPGVSSVNGILSKDSVSSSEAPSGVKVLAQGSGVRSIPAESMRASLKLPTGSLSSSAIPVPRTVVKTAPDVLAVPYEEKKNAVSSEQRTPLASLSVTPASKTAETAASTGTHPKPRPALPPKAAAAKTPNPTPASAQNAQKTQNSSGWSVQVAAFSIKAAADDVAQQLSKDGRSVRVVSGGTMHKVLIRANDKNDASALAARMDRSGFPGAFVVAP